MSRRLTALLLCAAALLGGALAEGLTVNIKNPPNNCVEGCNDAVGEVSFSDMDANLTYYGMRCTSIMFSTSLALCSKTYCTPYQQQKGWEKIGGYCSEYGEVELPPMETLLSAMDENNVTRDVDVIANMGVVYNNTILVDQASWMAGFKTENAWTQEMINHHAFGWYVYILLGATVLVGGMNRLFGLFVQRYATSTEGYSPEAASAPPANNSKKSRWYTLYRKHIEVPAMFGYKHSQAAGWGWLSVPTRIQGIFIFAYVALNVIFTCVGYDIFYDNMYWYGEKDVQIARYLADRTGIMAFYNLPLLWCLAGRNDVILWLTGWSYTSLNLLHRWVSRVTVVQAIIHSVAYTWLERDYLAEEMKERYWVTGVVATILMSLMIPLSVRPFRERFYEIFLLLHIVFALASLVMLWYHVYIFEGEYDPFIWASVAVWALDRFVRVCRVLILTRRALSRSGTNTVATLSTVGGASDRGLIRLSIETSLKITPKPGEYYFLYTPFSLKPWENHPFTLASWRVNDRSTTTLDFLVAPLSGATKRWQKKILRKGERSTSMRLLLEGPYGSSHPVEMYDRVLFIAGGSGITSALPYLHKLRQIAAQVPEPITREITLVWIVKDRTYAADVLSHELKDFIQDATSHGLALKIKMFVTREDGATPQAVINTLSYGSSGNVGDESESTSQTSDSASGPVSDSGPVTGSSQSSPEPKSIGVMEKQPPSGSGSDLELDLSYKHNGVIKTSKSSALTIIPGRPIIKDVLDEAVSQLVGGEKLAVSACGPAKMMDDTRRAVCDIYGNGEGQVHGRTVEYFEELFSW
ncbi:hypothetical protein I317_01255 [Kwoniella heveanensis CBS 569]|nr:hypothetical protein I317_01255 [Kwoniella heveanensis CBS 569]